ncbi:MAG: hypothetical protein IPP62_19015 [bacterium]|nr:hypothetical protein [bacterium]
MKASTVPRGPMARSAFQQRRPRVVLRVGEELDVPRRRLAGRFLHVQRELERHLLERARTVEQRHGRVQRFEVEMPQRVLQLREQLVHCRAVHVGHTGSHRRLLHQLKARQLAVGHVSHAGPAAVQPAERLAAGLHHGGDVVVRQAAPADRDHRAVVRVAAVRADGHLRPLPADRRGEPREQLRHLRHQFARFGRHVVAREQFFRFDRSLAHVARVDVHQVQAVQLHARALDGAGLERHVPQVDLLDPRRRLHLDQVPRLAAARRGRQHVGPHVAPSRRLVAQEAGLEHGTPFLQHRPCHGHRRLDVGTVARARPRRHLDAAREQQLGQVAHGVAHVEHVLRRRRRRRDHVAVVVLGPQQQGALQAGEELRLGDDGVGRAHRGSFRSCPVMGEPGLAPIIAPGGVGVHAGIADGPAAGECCRMPGV